LKGKIMLQKTNVLPEVDEAKVKIIVDNSFDLS